MKHTKLPLSACLWFLAACAQADVPAPQPEQAAQTVQQAVVLSQAGRTHARYTGRVTAVADGDTLRITDTNGARHKIRLAYIDAPEMQQAHGRAAQQALSKTALGQTVEAEVYETDRYKRNVAKVRLNGRDLNLAQIENGHAWHYASIAKRKQNKADYAAYAYAQAVAQQAKTGLWRGANIQAPWAFRKHERERQQGFSGTAQ